MPKSPTMCGVQFLALDHVQLSMPPGSEHRAREFYVDLLGMTELPKPPKGAGQGGCWFKSGPVELHLGIEEPFRPATRGHPAVVVSELEPLVERLRGAGYPVVRGGKLAGRERVHGPDCFGNRIEWIELE